MQTKRPTDSPTGSPVSESAFYIEQYLSRTQLNLDEYNRPFRLKLQRNTLPNRLQKT